MKVWARITQDDDVEEGFLNVDHDGLVEDEDEAAEFDDAREAYTAAESLLDADEVHELHIRE